MLFNFRAKGRLLNLKIDYWVQEVKRINGLVRGD